MILGLALLVAWAASCKVWWLAAWLLVMLFLWLRFFHTPMLKGEELPPPVVTLPLGLPGAVDKRKGFRKILGQVVDAHPTAPDRRPVSDILHDLDGESGEAEAVQAAGRKTKIILVSGVVWECFSDVVLPFGAGQHGLPPEGRSDRTFLDDYSYLQDTDANAEVVEVVRVQGIATSEHNSERVAQALLKYRDDPAHLVLVAYSKGVQDTLVALLKLQTLGELPANLRAVVSVAGAVSGSPLGDWLNRYKGLLARMPTPAACSHVDENFLESITSHHCLHWLRSFWGKMPTGVRFYSLVTFVPPERMHWLMRILFARMAMVEPRNDSHVTIQDQVFPGGHLLGYVRADHWAVVLPFNRSKRSVWNALLKHNNAFPREVLFEGILRFVRADLGL